MTQKCRQAPEGCDLGPALEVSLCLGSICLGEILSIRRHSTYSGCVLVNIEGELLGAVIGPVEVLWLDEREDEGVQHWTEGGGYGPVDAGKDLTSGGDGHSSVQRICGTKPDREACDHAEEGRDDGGEAALTAPQDGKGGREDTGAGKDTCYS